MYNVYLFQPQYAIDHNDTEQYWIPYSVGCLWSYAQQFDWVRNNFILKDLIFKREITSDLINRLENPHLCCFSCYVWNEQYNLTIAKLIKSKWPECIIVFGGPQVNSSTLDFNFIDAVVLNEGEQSFVSILDSILKQTKINSLYIGQRMIDLDIPSPYITGVFDQLISENPGAQWHMTLETNRGCPYQCTFCDWGSLTYSKVKQFNLSKVQGEIEWASKNLIVYIFNADANFGIFKERDKQIAILMKEKLSNTTVETINLTFAKNSNETIMEIAKILGSLNRGVTVSVQSLNSNTLESIKRKNLNMNDMTEIFSLSKKHKVKPYSEFILGLPNETIDSWKQGLTDILEYGQHQSIEFTFCQLLKNSELSSQQSRKNFKIKTILAKDYLSTSKNKKEEIPEFIELIIGTSTMSFDDIVEGYMYAWMIVQFHIGGYSQILARESRLHNNIPYKDFYNCLYKNMLKSYFSEHVTLLSTSIKNYLLGNNDTNIVNGLHSFVFDFSSKFIYDHKEKAFQLSYETYVELVKNENLEKFTLQKLFIYDANIQYPHDLTINNTNYTIKDQGIKYINFFAHRRQGYLKNSIIKQDQILY